MSLARRTPLCRCPVSLHRVAAAAALFGAQLVHRHSRRHERPTRPRGPATLPVVTVTADDGPRTSRDVPSSVQHDPAPSCSTSINTGGQDLRGLSGRVPNLNIESSFGRAFPRVYIRGYGNTDFRLNASQPVSLVYDDVVQENPILKGFPCSTSSASKCCAVRRAPCSAATRRPAW